MVSGGQGDLADGMLGMLVQCTSIPLRYLQSRTRVSCHATLQRRRCASRDSTNQNALSVEWFSRLQRAVFRGICGEIFALFQVCVVISTLYPRGKLLVRNTLSLSYYVAVNPI